jgi:hypothetical protein
VFYVDTNVFWRPYGPDKKFQSAPLTADLWRRLREKHPDTLFIPEFASTGDYASTAGYGEADMGNYGVPPVARALYPDAFRVIVIEDADAAENYDRFLAAIEAGNSLMTFGQGRNHFNTLMIRRMQDDLSLRKSAVPPQVSAAGGDQLPDLLDSADKAVVFHTTMRLGETPAANAAPRLLTIVQNEEMDWPIRRAALVALGKTPYAPAVPVLFELLSDKQTGLYADASRALAGQDASVEELAVEAIRAAATRKGNAAECDQIGAVLVLRKASARALAIQEIFSTLPETDGPLRRSLVTLIGELRNPESEAFLLGLLDQPQLGPTAAAGLVRIGTPSAVAAVKSAQTAAQKGGNKELAGAYGRALQVK